MTTIHITLESEPHTENLDGVMLNRPAPQGGAFLISQRLDRAIWNKLKAAGAWYISADDLEDFDMFDAEPGWRYSLAALKVLLANGYTLDLRGETVTVPDQLDAMFTDEAKAIYRAKRQAKREARQRAEAEKKAEAERIRIEKGDAYQSWKAEHLTGLVKTYANPNISLNWQQAAGFDSDTPGTWYTTGDSWNIAECNGKTVYQCYYGNAVCYYAPQEIVDEWVRAELAKHVNDNGEVSAARWVFTYADHYAGCIGGDVAVRLGELYGLEHFAQIARRETWLFVEDSLNWKMATAQKYGLPFLALKHYKKPDGKYPQYAEVSQILHPTLIRNNQPEPASEILADEQGRVYGKTYHDEFWQLADEQIAMLNGAAS